MSSGWLTSALDSVDEMYLSIPLASFEWSAAPLSSWRAPVAAVLAYLLLVVLLMQHMKSRDAYGVPNWVVAAHNRFLSLCSLVMFVGCSLALLSRFKREQGQFEWFFCNPVSAGDSPANGQLYFWSYIYYLSKYYELLDTVFVLLRKSKVPHFTLQVYHHAMVIIMAWLWVESQQTLQFGGLLFNTFVHVIMYDYYAKKVMKIPTPWKEWITRLQIVQFMFSICCLCGTAYLVLVHGKTCLGLTQSSYYSLWFNTFFNITLLKSFVGVAKRKSNPKSTLKKKK